MDVAAAQSRGEPLFPGDRGVPSKREPTADERISDITDEGRRRVDIIFKKAKERMQSRRKAMK